MAREKLVVVTEVMTGGVRKHVVDLLMGLDKESYEITFVYSRLRADATAHAQLGQLSREGVRLLELPMRRGPAPLSDVGCLVGLTRILRRLRPRIVHLHGAKAGALGRIAAHMSGIRHVVYTPHGGSFHRFADSGGRVYLAIERLLAKPSVHFIGVSEHSCRQVKSAIGVGDANVHLVHNGIDLARIDQGRSRRDGHQDDLGMPSDRFVVLYPGLFLETKGHLEFLDALGRSATKLRSEILIVLAGEGPLAPRIAQRVKALHLDHHFRFVGFQPLLDRFYERCAMVLLPSKGEGLPYVLMEAMAHAKPIIATTVGGIPELVVDGWNGELVACENLTVIPARLNYYSEHPGEARRLGRNGRLAIERGFTVEGMVSGTARVYEQVLGRL